MSANNSVGTIVQQVMDLSIENAYIKYAKQFDAHTNRMVTRSKLESMNTAYLVAFARWIAENAAYPENYVDEILQIACVINERKNESVESRLYAISQVKLYASNFHPYGNDFKRRIDEVTL